jgi:phospholipid transport system transporter-binding protein
MNRVTIVNDKPGLYIVDGDLIFSTIDKKTVDIFKHIPANKTLIIDLGGVGKADSAGLALMFEWLKVARSKRMQLKFRNIPGQILSVAKLSGIDQLDIFTETYVAEPT